MFAPIRRFNGYALFALLEKRSKRVITPKLKELKAFEMLDRADRARVQREQMFKMLMHARQCSPYYADIFNQVGFDPEKVLTDIKFVEDLPLLTKQIVRDNTERIRTPHAHIARKTGGSTGQSVFFFYDNEGLDWTSAINLRAYEMAGNYRHRRDAHIASDLGLEIPTRKDKFMDWLKLLTQNRSRLFIKSFSDSDLAWSFQQLLSIKPYLLQGHPSSGYALALYAKNHRLPKKKYVDVFEPSGETVTPKMVSAMEEFLGCKVVNRYGNAEFGVMAHSRAQDPYTKLQVFDRAFYVEEVEQGNLIFTGLTNTGMPLIRYDTGDVGTVKREMDGTFIYDLRGRVHDTVTIDAEVYATHYIMDYLDHKITGVREFQIIVNGQAAPILYIVPENEADSSRIGNEIKKRWPNGVDVKMVKFEELKKVGWQGKFRHVVDLTGRS